MTLPPMPKKTDYTSSGVFLLIIYVLIMLIVGFCFGCRTVDLQKTNTDRKVDSVIVTKYDSTALRQSRESEKFLREIVKDYAQREPQAIVTPEGKTVYVPQPPTIIRETIRETAEKENEAKEQTTVNRSDSAILRLIEIIATKDKETTGLPLTTVIMMIGITAAIVLAGAALIKRKTQ